MKKVLRATETLDSAPNPYQLCVLLVPGKISITLPERDTIWYSKHHQAAMYLLFFFYPISYRRPSFLPPSRNSDRSHIAGSSPPSPLRCAPCIFIARRLQPFLPSSTRVEIAPTCARRSQQLILSILQISSKSHHGGIRTPVPTVAAFDGNHLTTGPTEYDIGI